ncbi:hypothetical protein E2C01_067732 [Portunus trituberculatus]|uniref:Uncharacterized protein n=1 Tax=Portunus trituberculatus TaxID=210409 RepID=A0A5B7HY74_PORTR|nr:hypothetical protein [Portunus trituberculatus]
MDAQDPTAAYKSIHDYNTGESFVIVLEFVLLLMVVVLLLVRVLQ